MTFDPDTAYAGDYAHQTGIEDWTFKARDDSGSPVSSVKVKRKSLTKNDIIALSIGTSILPTDLKLAVWASTLGGKTPTSGDQFKDASNVKYTVVTATLRTHQTIWDVIVRAEVS